MRISLGSTAAGVVGTAMVVVGADAVEAGGVGAAASATGGRTSAANTKALLAVSSNNIPVAKITVFLMPGSSPVRSGFGIRRKTPAAVRDAPAWRRSLKTRPPGIALRQPE